MSLNGFCCGAVAGLVCITPASGFTSPHYAPVFGILGAVCCYFACFIKGLTGYRYDDACDVFGGKSILYLYSYILYYHFF